MDFPSISRGVISKEGIFVISVCVWLGILLFLGSLAVAYLDSIGYWNYPKDFIRALFADRGSELIGLGVQGLQLFHYSAGGLILSAFSIGLLGVKGKLSEIFLVKRKMTERVDLTSSSIIARKRDEELDAMSDPILQEALWPEIADIATSRALLAHEKEDESVIEEAYMLLHE